MPVVRGQEKSNLEIHQARLQKKVDGKPLEPPASPLAKAPLTVGFDRHNSAKLKPWKFVYLLQIQL